MNIREMKQLAEAEIEAVLEKLWSEGHEVFRVHVTPQNGEPPIVSIVFDNGRGQQ